MTFVSRPRRSGSILLMLVLGLFVFVAAFGLIASGQLAHTRRLGAEYGHLQALYAAESGVYAALDAKASTGTKTLWSDTANLVQYSGTMESASAPSWITGVGTAKIRGDLYTAQVRGYTIGTRIMLWDFGQ